MKKADREAAAAAQKEQREFAFGGGTEPAGGCAEARGLTPYGQLCIEFAKLPPEARDDFLDQFHPGALLDSLARRGGTLKACADAQLLVLKKSADYNNTGANKGTAGTFAAQRDDYFPFGLKSYAQMLHTKSQRLISLANKDGNSIFESARDTMLDLINYASFGADWLHREELSRQLTDES